MYPRNQRYTPGTIQTKSNSTQGHWASITVSLEWPKPSTISLSSLKKKLEIKTRISFEAQKVNEDQFCCVHDHQPAEVSNQEEGHKADHIINYLNPLQIKERGQIETLGDEGPKYTCWFWTLPPRHAVLVAFRIEIFDKIATG